MQIWSTNCAIRWMFWCKAKNNPCKSTFIASKNCKLSLGHMHCLMIRHYFDFWRACNPSFAPTLECVDHTPLRKHVKLLSSMSHHLMVTHVLCPHKARMIAWSLVLFSSTINVQLTATMAKVNNPCATNQMIGKRRLHATFATKRVISSQIVLHSNVSRAIQTKTRIPDNLVVQNWMWQSNLKSSLLSWRLWKPLHHQAQKTKYWSTSTL